MCIEKAFQRCFEQLEAGVCVIGKDTHEILYYNTAMRYLTGTGVQRGALCYEVFRGKNVPCEDCAMRSDSGSLRQHPWHRAERIQGLLFNRAFVEWSKKPAYVIFCTALSVNGEIRQQTVWKKQELLRNLEESLKAAKKANQAKSEFLSRMSHDIRTPMNAIIGMTNMALSYENIPETLTCLEKIQSSSQFLLSLINDILDVSKIESRQLKLSPEPYVLKEFVDQVSQIIQPLCKAKEIDFVVMVDFPENCCVFVDHVRFKQIFLNLLSNAVKYTPNGGWVEFSIENQWQNKRVQQMRFRVSDTGIGMSREFQQHMFEPFSQEDSRHVTESAGTGLGLSIVRSLVELMHGTIAVQSEPGYGSMFAVQLKLRTCTASQTVTAGQNKGSEGRLIGYRVLLCEDNALNTEVADWILQQAGIEVENAADGQEAIQVFARSKPYHYDAVLMDIRMPHMDGLEAARRIRSMSRPDAGKVPIIAMTADAFEEDRQRSLQAGMNAHITKPLSPEILYRTLLRFMDSED